MYLVFRCTASIGAGRDVYSVSLVNLLGSDVLFFFVPKKKKNIKQIQASIELLQFCYAISLMEF